MISFDLTQEQGVLKVLLKSAIINASIRLVLAKLLCLL